jgi:uroporphyrinogen-III synthase
MKRVLVLRPEPGASETAARARQLGLDPVVAPLFAVQPVPWKTPEASQFDAVLLTSANALRHGGDGLKELRALPAYAVGPATAEAARDAGFDIAATGDAGVARLLGSIDSDLRLVHLCGEDRTDVADARQQVTPTVVYRSRPLQSPDVAAFADSVALIHSPRAGRRFAELVERRETVAVAAISAEAAEAVGQGWLCVEAADEPTDAALLALAARLCEKPPRG